MVTYLSLCKSGGSIQTWPRLIEVIPLGNDFSLHDHVYSSPNVPDPNVAVVTYRFDTPAIVKGVQIFQHTNGISKIEGFFGNAPGSLTSLGAVFGPSGDVTGISAFTEGQAQNFDFGNTTNAGTFFQFVVRKTPLSNGWASYRAFPLDVNGTPFDAAQSAPSTPEPGSMALFVGMACTASLFLKRCRSGTPVDTRHSESGCAAPEPILVASSG